MRFLFVILALFPFSPALAQDRDTGIGLTLGNPVGLTGRTWLSGENSLGYGAGWAITDTNKFQVYADYLWARPHAFEVSGERLDFFFGGGLGLRSNSGKSDGELVFGPRIPVGVSYEFSDPDLEIYLLAAFNAGLIPSADIYLDLHLGARFYVF